MPLLLLPVIILVALALYIFFGGRKIPAPVEAIIDEVLRADLPERIQGQTGFVTSNGIKIWYERIPPPADIKGTVMLLSSMAADSMGWPPAFVHAFLDAGYAVIRFDPRGTGLSDWLENWDRRQPYTLVDMAGDAAAVLDALSIERVHLVGLSLGGMVAQEMAVHHSARVASLTLIMTSAYAPDPTIPGLTTRTVLRSAVRGLPLLRYRIMGGERNLIRERVAKTLQVLGPGGWDVRETAEMVLYDLRNRRGINLRALIQHQAAVSVTPPRYAALERLKVPALIIHGTKDEIIPIEHGKKLAAAIPGSRSIWLDGVGHVFPPPGLPALIEAMISLFESDPAAIN